jgi:hypothetical protein
VGVENLGLQTRGDAPRDGRVYRGYFERSSPRGAMFKAVSWSAEQGWIDLLGEPIDEVWRLAAWSPE